MRRNNAVDAAMNALKNAILEEATEKFLSSMAGYGKKRKYMKHADDGEEPTKRRGSHRRIATSRARRPMAMGAKRPAGQIEKLIAKLKLCIRKSPGKSLGAYAEKLGVKPYDLQYPAKKLRRDKVVKVDKHRGSASNYSMV